MANHVHPDGWMWGEGIAVNNDRFFLTPGNVITMMHIVMQFKWFASLL